MVQEKCCSSLLGRVHPLCCVVLCCVVLCCVVLHCVILYLIPGSDDAMWLEGQYIQEQRHYRVGYVVVPGPRRL